MTRKIWNLARKPIKRPMQVLDKDVETLIIILV